jgi:flagellar biosynthesis protein FlhG
MRGDQAERLRELARRAPVATDMRQSAGPRARTLVVTSGKGGVGKTNVTVNLALAMAKRGVQTVLFDADMGMANVDVLLGISPPHSIADVLRGQQSLLSVMVEVNSYLRIVPGGSGISELANLEGPQLDAMIAQLGTLENQADLILIDTGAGISRTVLNFVLAADEILVVTTPEPTAVTDAYGMIKEIDAKNPNAKVQLLVNMVESEAEGRSIAGKLIMIVERFLSLKVSYIGCIERDSNVSRSVLQQQPFFNAYPYSTATRRLNMLAGTLLAQREQKAQKQGFFSRLVGQIFG